jgi:hypothetical protein
MIKVELFYDSDCPSPKEARQRIELAFKELGLKPQYQEYDRDSCDVSSYAKNIASPSVFVNGKDVSPGELLR